MLLKIINKIKWALFEQPSFARIDIQRVVPAALKMLSDGIIMEIGAGRHQTLKNELPSATTYVSVNILLECEPDIVADALRLPLPNESVDGIILLEVLEHVPEPALLLNECLRVLKPNGTLVGTTRFIIYEHAAPFDYHRFTVDGLLHLLRGFERARTVKLGNKFQVIMDLLSEKRPCLRMLNKFLFRFTRKTNATCYAGIFFEASKRHTT